MRVKLETVTIPTCNRKSCIHYLDCRVARNIRHLEFKPKVEHNDKNLYNCLSNEVNHDKE